MTLWTKSYGVTIQNETLSAVLLHGTIYISVFYKMKFGIDLIWYRLGTEGLGTVLKLEVAKRYK